MDKQEIIEVWLPIVGLEGLYEVSDRGNVRSLDRLVNGHNGKKLKKGQPCKPYLRDRYLCVGLSSGGKRKNYPIHRIEAIAHIPNPENKSTVNHKDGNKLNNLKANLEWATSSEQLLHAVKAGLFKPIPPTKKGDTLSAETRSKMSESQLRRYNSQKQ